MQWKDWTVIRFITFTKMISVKRKDISRIEMNDKDGIKRSVVKIYTMINGEIKVIWEAIRSCFGSG